MDYSKHVNARRTPQDQPIFGVTDQVANSSGGYVWEASIWAQLDRFLILGTEMGSYYANERNMTLKNANAVSDCIKENGIRVVDRVIEISTAGRAPKNDPALFVLAMCAAAEEDDVRAKAIGAIPAVARTGTHLFAFCQFVNAFRGWGRGLKNGIARWYTEKDANDLAYQLIKYQSRGGWSHADVLRLAHPNTKDDAKRAAFAWATGYQDRKDYQLTEEARSSLPEMIVAKNVMAKASGTKGVIRVIRDHPGFPWEGIQTEFLKDPKVWQALVPQLPVMATIRNLARMTASGAIQEMTDTTQQVIEKITDAEILRKARVHPVSILAAMKTYETGYGNKGNLTWRPIASVVNALDDAYYASFGNVEPTGKRIMLAIDVSGSMDAGCIAGIAGLTPRVGAAAMAMVTERVEEKVVITAFSDGTAKTPISRLKGESKWGSWSGKTMKPMLEKISISSRERLDDVVRKMASIPMGGTDCSLPMRAALDAKMKIDMFVIYTDSETWFGSIHPSQALDEYRQKMGIDAKLVVVGMVANEFSIADPQDPRQLDVVGFDTTTPSLISEFAMLK